MGISERESALQKLSSLYRNFCLNFPKQTMSRTLHQQIKQGEDLWNRKNWTGHMTASAIVLNTSRERCVMIGHKGLGLDLVPGGHCDPYELPNESALREFCEETGLPRPQLHPWHIQNGLCPIDIDSHQIPANFAKGESKHLHHDFRYLCVLDGEYDMRLNELEGTWVEWKRINSIAALYPRVHSRVEALI